MFTCSFGGVVGGGGVKGARSTMWVLKEAALDVYIGRHALTP